LNVGGHRVGVIVFVNVEVVQGQSNCIFKREGGAEARKSYS
jgi:hypothetical protein